MLRLILLLLLLTCQSLFANYVPSSSVNLETASRDSQIILNMNKNWYSVKASGVSMNPIFGDNTILLVDKCDVTEVSFGMIIVYEDHENDLVAHKVVSIKNGVIKTKGINNTKVDPDIITSKNFKGIVFGMLHTNTSVKSLDIPIVYGKS